MSEIEEMVRRRGQSSAYLPAEFQLPVGKVEGPKPTKWMSYALPTEIAIEEAARPAPIPEAEKMPVGVAIEAGAERWKKEVSEDALRKIHRFEDEERYVAVAVHDREINPESPPRYPVEAAGRYAGSYIEIDRRKGNWYQQATCGELIGHYNQLKDVVSEPLSQTYADLIKKLLSDECGCKRYPQAVPEKCKP